MYQKRRDATQFEILRIICWFFEMTQSWCLNYYVQLEWNDFKIYVVSCSRKFFKITLPLIWWAQGSIVPWVCPSRCSRYCLCLDGIPWSWRQPACNYSMKIIIYIDMFGWYRQKDNTNHEKGLNSLVFLFILPWEV